MLSSAFFASKESENNWRNYMILTYKTPLETIPSGPSIFQLSKILKDTKPEAYIPQSLGLGPFHHCRPELQEKMLWIKRAALSIHNVELQRIMELLKSLPWPFEERIQSCYGSYLDFDKETLILIVIVDSICLLHALDVLENYKGQPGEEEEVEPSLMISDMMMLENQIPITLIDLVLRDETLAEEFTQLTSLFDIFYEFVSKLSPVKLADDDRDYMREIWGPPKHLLHFMYKFAVGRKLAVIVESRKFVPGSTEETDSITSQSLASSMQSTVEINSAAEAESTVSNILRQTGDSLVYAGGQAGEFFIRAIEEINSLTAAYKDGGLRVPTWFDKTVQGIGKAVSSSEMKQASALDKVHSVSELYNIPKLTFHALPVGCGFGNIVFDKIKKVVYLPMMTLHANSEVILRNLLAFEAAYKDARQGPQSEVRDHMCAIIKTEKDVQLLKDAKVIETQLKDEDVVKLFKSIKKNMERLGNKSSFIDAFGRYTNEDYDNVPIVKACNWIKKWALAFLNFVKRIWPVFVVLLLFLQTLCDIYDCRRWPWFGTTRETADLPLQDSSFLSLEPKAELLKPRKFLHYYS
ncbi:putative UPF0481 protein At3g02645 [Coffea arabica]|uniref:UPF0481 protein At3g02645 n=1 Tax=Coffea arabica TaxID=13443 RepID=A0A6P6UE83_COFAR|nr:putative UPF0481 protein At3g02645 [Coffea arabica]